MSYQSSKILRTVLICVIAEILNLLTTYFFYQVLKIPLFFDTIFVVAVVFYAGLVPGLCVSIGYSIINSLMWINKTGFFDPFILSYGICGVLIVVSTWLIARNKKEFKISISITILYLFLIALVSSMCSIIAGGIIDYFHYRYYEITDMMNPIKNFTEGFVNQRFSLIASCILAQIPVSFLDRLIATFAGYGIYKICDKYIERR